MRSMFASLVFFVGIFGTCSLALGASRTAAHEKLIENVCASQKPVLVIDTFDGNQTNEMNIDLDGDGAFDMHHGDFVSRLVHLHGQSTIKEVIGTPVFSHQLLEVLLKYIAQIESGQLELSWINFSQGYTVEIDSLNRVIGQKGKINEFNVHLFGSEVLQALWTSKPKLKLKELNEAFLRLQELGIPVFVAAANSGYKEVNLYSLFPNVYSVGSIDLQGRKADYSADNSTVTIWRKGDVRAITNGTGLDLNEDGRVDVQLDTPLVSIDVKESLRGRRAQELVQSVPRDIDEQNNNNTSVFHGLVRQLPRGLYSTNQILSKSLATPFQQSRYIKTLGDYFYMDGLNTMPLVFLKVNGAGELLLQQGKDEGIGQFRNTLYGTSFSSPSICDGTVTPEKFAL